jgi:flagellin
LTIQQRGAANTEYQSILTEINQIGSSTEFNGANVFTDGNNSPVSIADAGSTITGTIDPADREGRMSFEIVGSAPADSALRFSINLTRFDLFFFQRESLPIP